MFAPPMTLTCDIIEQGEDKYSAYVEISRSSWQCWFREIIITSDRTHLRGTDADAIIWLPVDAPLKVGSLIEFDGERYMVNRFTKARRLGEEPQFLKGELTRSVWNIS